MDRSSQVQRAFWFAMIALAIALVVVKLLTGLSLAPLAVIGLFVFLIAFGLKLRIERGARLHP